MSHDQILISVVMYVLKKLKFVNFILHKNKEVQLIMSNNSHRDFLSSKVQINSLKLLTDCLQKVHNTSNFSKSLPEYQSYLDKPNICIQIRSRSFLTWCTSWRPFFLQSQEVTTSRQTLRTLSTLAREKNYQNQLGFKSKVI